MEDNTSQQPNSNVVSPAVQPAPPPVPTPAPQQNAQPTAPEKKPRHYLITAFGIIWILVLFLPNSSFAQNLAIPIIILGGITGIKFFVDAIRSSKAKNALVRSFIILGGLGIGVVIFIVSFIAGTIVGFSKDPNPQSTG